MARGGRNIPELRQAWALRGKFQVIKRRGATYVASWPKPFGPARSQAQKDTQTAFAQIQRAMKFNQPAEWIDAITSTKGSGIYPRDYLFSCMSGNMILLGGTVNGGTSAAIDKIVTFTAAGGETTFTLNGIPPGYTSLFITGLARSAVAATFENITVRFNQDSNNNYDTFGWFSPTGSFTNIAANAGLVGSVTGASAPASYPSAFFLDIPAYTTPMFKIAHGMNNRVQALSAGNFFNASFTNYWRSVAAITRIDLTLAGGFIKGSAITIFGRY